MAGLYHERQSLQLCAVHALNNLFQNAVFKKADLDQISENLTPGKLLNPHRSIFRTGNFDVNVVMAALQTHDYDLIWFDKRRDVHSLQLENIFGFILNISTNFTLGFVSFPISRKHWIAVRQVDGTYYNFDSKLDTPQLIGDGTKLFDYLAQQALMDDRQILVVVSTTVVQSGSWSNGRTNEAKSSDASSPVHSNGSLS